MVCGADEGLRSTLWSACEDERCDCIKNPSEEREEADEDDKTAASEIVMLGFLRSSRARAYGRGTARSATGIGAISASGPLKPSTRLYPRYCDVSSVVSMPACSPPGHALQKDGGNSRLCRKLLVVLRQCAGASGCGLYGLAVGAGGFEPPASRSRSVRAAELRYAPKSPLRQRTVLYPNRAVLQR